MTCPACGADNRDGARFCGECAASLVKPVVCAGCGTSNPGGRKFCDACGAPLSARPAEKAETRKVVTIVFADLIGSTGLHERLDPESVSHVMDRYHRAVRAPVEAHGGTVVQLLGDGVMCAFGVPRVAEDDAIRAVHAAVAVQQAFQEFAQAERALVGTIGLRVAVNTGEVVVSDEYAAGIGDPLNVAARLQQEARDGDVLIGEPTQRLVADRVTLERFGTFALRGRAESVTAYRVVSLERPAGVPASAFVGRDDEVRRLMAVYETAVAERRARLAVILGSPGLGKSRLLGEITRRLGTGATVLTARCDAAGGATFAPLAEALRSALGLDDGASRDAMRAAIEAVVPTDESARIAAGIGALLAATPASPEETFYVVRRLLAALAAAQPVVLVIDDLQWAEPLLLDLTEHLVQWTTGVPLLVLVAARPELRDARSSLATSGDLVTDVVTLGGLDAGAAMRLAANVIGAEELPAAITGRVLATSEGNPLFVGELVRMLVHDGVLKREGDRWTTAVALADLEMPPTIQALLAARIERLRPEERTVLERAAVIGRQFSRAAIAHLLPREITDLDARLEGLRRSELIERDAGWFLGEPVLRFHHVLIRDAAYRRVLKGTRAELHARLAEWIEAKVGDAVEHDETLGWHFEQAHQNLRELGPVDAHGRALGERAARHLAAAGRRALARDDVSLAASLLGRALDRLDAADPARADLVLDWCEALLAAGDVAHAAGAVEELGRFVGDSERLRAWHTCFAGQLAALTDPQALHGTVEAVAAAAGTLVAAGDGIGEAKAHSVHAIVLARLGKVGECEAALDRALAAARRVHDRRRSNAVLSGAPLAALWGPSPVTRASGRCLDVVRVLRITAGAPAVEAVALRCQAVLEALRGRTDAARRMLASSRRMVEELGIMQRLLEADVAAGQIELFEDDAVAAERCLRTAYDGLRAHGLRIDAAQAAAYLGRALLALGRDTEAEALSHESEALAGDDLRAAVAWRGVRAEALARRGEHAAAVEFARAAVAIASATDALLDHAAARRALGAALRAAGRGAEADAEEARTIELWEAKGATLLVERARKQAPRVVERATEQRAAPVPGTRRRVRANAATASAARFDAAIGARDHKALANFFPEDHQAIDHTTACEEGRQEAIAGYRAFLEAEDPSVEHVPLATLGESLAMFRYSRTFSGASLDGTMSLGAVGVEKILLLEVDPQGRRRRLELFADDRLTNAITRLYERHAELLPDGPARTRAAAMARAVGTALRFIYPDDSFAPDIEFVDRRRIGMLGVSRGSERVARGLRTYRGMVDDITVRVHDVLALRPDGFLVPWTTAGIDRAGGGAIENHMIMLVVYAADGRMRQVEFWDDDRPDEALARFDELTAEPMPSRRARRVAPNAATAVAARFDATMASRDIDAYAALLGAEYSVVHHWSRTTYDRQASIADIASVLRAVDDLACTHEPLATLGDSLGLCRRSAWMSGATDGDLSVGPATTDNAVLIEVNDRGLYRRSDVFAGDRLGEAITRLYERYAELLPDGPARTRAAATARTIATLLGPFDPDGLAAACAPGIELVDHRTGIQGSTRGRDVFLKAARSLVEVAADVANRVDDILALRSDAILLRWTNSGTDRAGGGAYERHFLYLWVFGADGLATHNEVFDADRVEQALARLDELTTPTIPSRARRKRGVRPNAATVNATRSDAAIAARDIDAFAALLAPGGSEFVHHPTGTTYDRQASLTDLCELFQSGARDLAYAHDPLATLGDSLALFRRAWSVSGAENDRVSIGAARMDNVVLVDVDGQGLRRCTEIFADDRLGDAVARLYERHGELLPDGRERARAVATARTAATVLSLPRDPDRYATVITSNIEFVDHQPIGLGSARSAALFLRGLRAMHELADNVTLRVDDVLALRSDALVTRQTNFGTLRAGGGDYERHFLSVWVFGVDGLLARVEWFAADRDDDALARFDELTADRRTGPSRAPRPRVRTNAATANAALFDTTVNAHDSDGIVALFDHLVEGVHHPLGVTYDRAGAVVSVLGTASARDLTYHHDPLATLGDSLAVCRLSLSTSGYALADIDVGAIEVDSLVLIEVDASGHRRRVEFFADDHLVDAVLRLYERHAELLPDGADRTRAAVTARSLRSIVTFDRSHSRAALRDDIEFVDQRRLGFESMRGADDMMRRARALFDLADDVTLRFDEILDLRRDGILYRPTVSGTDRASGGRFEQTRLQLYTFGADGLIARSEWFDVEDVDAALARFDELVPEPAPPPVAARSIRHRVRPNAATANLTRMEAAIVARDADALDAGLADDAQLIDHTTGAAIDREGSLSTLRFTFKGRDTTYRSEPFATLGDSLVLTRISASGTGFAGGRFDVGAYETEKIGVTDVDAQGRRRRMEIFASDRLVDAVLRAYGRYAELLPEGAARDRAALIARSLRTIVTLEPNPCEPALDDDVEFVDHRRLGFEPTRGAGAFVRHFRALLDLAVDVRLRIDDVLDLRPDTLLYRSTVSGTDRASGGPFEQTRLELRAFGPDGLCTCREWFDVDDVDGALARFDELTAEPPPPRFANTAARQALRFARCVREHDWDGLVATVDPALRFDDRRRLVRLQLSGEQYLAHLRLLYEMGWTRWDSQLLATRGERLTLLREHLHADAGGAYGAAAGSEFATDCLTLVEIGTDGRPNAIVVFDPDDVDAAYAELYARHAAGEGAPYATLLANMEAMATFATGFERLLPDDFTMTIHRRFAGTGSPMSREEFVGWLRLTTNDLRARQTMRADHVLHISPRALLSVGTISGTVDGGDFETVVVWVVAHDGSRPHAIEAYDLDQLDLAFARFAELTGAATARIQNVATRWFGRFEAAWEARDWDRVAASFATGFRLIDRQKLARVEYDRDQQLEILGWTFRRTTRWRWDLLATRGERLALVRERLDHEGRTFGPTTLEGLVVAEVNAAGEYERAIVFDHDDLDAAYAELDRRYLAGEAAPYARTVEVPQRLLRAAASRDWAQWLAAFTEDFVLEDHRRLGWGTRSLDEFLAQNRAMIDLSPDAKLRGDHIFAIDHGRALAVARWVGTRDGGPFEIPLGINVFAIDPDGRIRRMDLYDEEELATAQARYDALAIAAPVPRIENAATRWFDRFVAAWEAHDWDRVAAGFAPGFRLTDFQKMTLAELDRDQHLACLEWTFRRTTRWAWQVVATRGERLALVREHLEHVGRTIGPTELEDLIIVEVNDAGAYERGALFDRDDLDAAYAELDRLYAAGEAAPHARSLETLGRLEQSLLARNWDQWAALYSDDLVLEDHRLLGWGTRSRDEFVEQVRALVDLASDVTLRADHVLAIDRRRALTVVRWVGTRDGGAFEIPMVSVGALTADGRIRRCDVYGLDQLDAARARYDAFAIEAGVPRIENAATRSKDRFLARWHGRDWDGVAAVYASGFWVSDRRPMVRLELDHEQSLGGLRLMFDTFASTYEVEVLATRGERLMLARVHWEGSGTGASRAVGPSEGDFLEIVEVNDHETRERQIVLDPGDVEAAYEELDRCFAAGEAAGHEHLRHTAGDFKRAFAAREWDTMAATQRPDFVVHDHRPLGWGTLDGPAYIESLKTLVALAPDARFRTDHAWVSRHGMLLINVMHGTREGGEFEAPRVVVSEHDDRGAYRRIDFYSLEQLDAARARFAELRPDPLRIPPNAATRAADRMHECGDARDWDAVRALCAPKLVYDDRRRALQNGGDLDTFMASTRYVFSHGARATRTLLATAGDQLALYRMVWRNVDDQSAYEIELLNITEVDADGRLVAMILFDPEDRRAATREMMERAARTEEGRAMPAERWEMWRAVLDRDLSRLRVTIPDDFVFHDHRRTGLGRVESADGFIAWVAALFEESPDALHETLYVVATAAHGSLEVGRDFGTLSAGGAFESFFVEIMWFETDRYVGVDLFEIEDLEVARARFEARRPDPLRIPPNAATRAFDRLQEAGMAHDWDVLRAVCAPALEYDDRRRTLRNSGDLEMFLASMRIVFTSRFRLTHRLLSTWGDRLALYHMLWRRTDAGAADTEMEFLLVMEVDADGRIVARITFDLDDRRAAIREMLERIARTEGGRRLPPARWELPRAMLDRDFSRFRAAIPDDFVFHDHRRTGAGRVEGADNYVAWLKSLFEQSEDAMTEPLYTVASAPHGAINVGRTFGTVSEGGPFESFWVQVMRFENDRFVGMELFEVEDLDVARARFEELRPDVTRIPPNAASRLGERTSALFTARDWVTLRTLPCGDFTYEDRRRQALTSGNVEAWMRSLQVVRTWPNVRITGELIGTAGDRIVLERRVTAGGAHGTEGTDQGPFENEFLRLLEIDADGRLHAWMVFDPDDRVAALDDAYARFVAGEASAAPAQVTTLAFNRAVIRRDWDAARTRLAEDFVFCDHRKVGLGTLGPDDMLAAIRAHFELAPDLRNETRRLLRWNERGIVALLHQHGTIPDGGPFENVLLRLVVADGERIRHIETFDGTDADRALARFEELCAERISTRRGAP